MSLMTKTEYARHRGVNESAIRKLEGRDRIFVTPDGKVDSEISDALLDNFSDSTSIEKTETANRNELLSRLTSTCNYAEQRALLTKYKADLASLELKQKRKELVPTATIKDTAFELGRKVRDVILSIPDRISPIVAAETKIPKIRKLLDTELRLALEELSK